MGNQRTEARLRSRGSFKIHASGAQPIDARLIDTSPSGMGLDAAAGLESGTIVRLECGGIEIAEAVVRHCKPHGARFLIGLSVSGAEL